MFPKDHAKNHAVILADQYLKQCYGLSKKLPREELFGITSQLRRAALSVPLNLIEGHARGTAAQRTNFSRISFGSLKETQYLLSFIASENLINEDELKTVFDIGDRLAAVLWRSIN